MKTSFLLSALAFTMSLSVGSLPAPGQPVAAKDMAAIEQFLNLPDAELEQMALIIERIRAMTPPERAALRQEIARFSRLPEPQRQQLRQGWGGMAPEIQSGWREMMQGVTPEKHAEIQAKLQSLAPEDKAAFRRKLVEEYLRAKAAKK